MNSQEYKSTKLDWSTAEDAYHIINCLLKNIQVTNDLIAIMASILGETATKTLVQTQAWAEYLYNRKTLESLSSEIEKFTNTMLELAKNQPDRQDQH